MSEYNMEMKHARDELDLIIAELLEAEAKYDSEIDKLLLRYKNILSAKDFNSLSIPIVYVYK